jgi:hypothetical protein
MSRTIPARLIERFPFRGKRRPRSCVWTDHLIAPAAGRTVGSYPRKTAKGGGFGRPFHLCHSRGSEQNLHREEKDEKGKERVCRYRRSELWWSQLHRRSTPKVPAEWRPYNGAWHKLTPDTQATAPTVALAEEIGRLPIRLACAQRDTNRSPPFTISASICLMSAIGNLGVRY